MANVKVDLMSDLGTLCSLDRRGAEERRYSDKSESKDGSSEHGSNNKRDL